LSLKKITNEKKDVDDELQALSVEHVLMRRTTGDDLQ